MTMNEFVSEVLPLAIAGSVSPTTLVIGILILTSRNRPLPKTFMFVLGNLLVLLGVGLVTLFFSHAITGASGHGSPSEFDSLLDVCVGILLVLITVRNTLKAPVDDAPPKWLAGIDTLGFVRSFLIGVGIMAINVSTLVVFMPAVRDIGKYGSGLTNELLFLAVVIAIVESWMLTALAVSTIAPQRSAKALRRLNGWVGKHSHTICAVLFGIFGIYFLIKGLKGLL